MLVRQKSMVALTLALALMAGATASGPAPNNRASRKGTGVSNPVMSKTAGTAVQSDPKLSSGFHTFGARWEAGNGRSTALILHNRDQQNTANITVTLFSADGQTEQTTLVTVAPKSLARLDLGDIVKPAVNSIHSGGLLVQSDTDITGDVVMEDAQNHKNLSFRLMGGYRFDTEGALYAPWWLPDDGADGTLTVFNSSEQAVTVAPSVTISGTSEKPAASFSLPGHGSVQLGLRDLIGKNNISGSVTGLLTLRYSGNSHALLPLLVLTNPNTGFVLVPHFNAQHSHTNTNSTIWQFPSVSVAEPASQPPGGSDPLTAYVLLSNSTQSTLEPVITAYFGTGVKQGIRKVALPIQPMAPQETRLVSLAQFIGSGLIPSGVSHFALVAGHGGSPGDLGMAVFSISQTSGSISQSQGTVLSTGTVDASFWDISARAALPQVKNRNNSSASAQVTVFFPTATGVGSYILPPMNLQAHGSRPLGLRSLLSSGIADANGNRFPAGINTGTLALSLLNGTGQTSVSAEQSAPECDKECSASSQDAVSTSSSSPANVAQNPPMPASQAQSAIFSSSAIPSGGVGFASTGCAPTVDAIDPNNGFLGKNIGVTLIGADFDPSDIITVTGGVSATVIDVSTDGTQITAEFDIPSGASTGDQNVTVSNINGDSQPKTFTVVKPLPPVLESVDPNNGDAGNTNLQVRLDGRFLAGDTINVTGGVSAIPLSISSDGQVMTTQFIIPICASPGQQQVSISDWLGQTSGTQPFTVNAPPAPTITGVNPNTLQAGTKTPLTIHGTGFNCGPAVTSDDGFITFDPPTFPNPDDPTTIQTNASVDANDPGGDVHIFVTTGGTGGGAAAISPARALSATSLGTASASGNTRNNQSTPAGKAPRAATASAQSTTKGGILSKPGNAAPAGPLVGAFFTSNGALVTVFPEQAPNPTIVFGTDGTACQGQNLAANGTVTPVLAGQKITLVACINGIDPKLKITSETWSAPGGTVVAAFDNGTLGTKPDLSGGHPRALQPDICQPAANSANQACPLTSNNQSGFYWLCPSLGRNGDDSCAYPGEATVTFQYQLEDKADPLSATATFSVNGPTGVNVTTSMRPVIVTSTSNPAIPLRLSLGNPGSSVDTSGIDFTLTGNPFPDPPPNTNPNPSYQWIQLLTSKTYQFLKKNGPSQCALPGVPNVIDTTYPYEAGNGPQEDSPDYGPLGRFFESEAQESFSASMFLLWDPGIRIDGQNCHTALVNAQGNMIPSTCDSIAIPIGRVDWHWSGDAISTLDTVTPPTDTNGWRAGAPDGQPGCGNPKDAVPAGSGPMFVQDLTFPQWNGPQPPGQNFPAGFNCNPPIQ